MKQLTALMLIVLSACLNSLAQSPTFQSVFNNTSGAQNSTIFCVGKDASGNTYFGGTHTDAITIDGISLAAGSGGALWGKMDPSGNVIWMRQGGTSLPASDKVLGVATDQQGNIYFCGSTAGNLTATFDGTAIAAGSIGFVLKYNSTGTKLWAEGYSTNIYAIAVDNNNQPVVNYGESALYRIDPANGTLNQLTGGFISGNLQNANLHNIVITSGNDIVAQAGNKIIKFDNAFNQLWVTNVTASLAETFRISLDNANNVYGTFYALFGTVTVGNVTKSNFPNGYVYKLDAATGNPLFIDSILIAGAVSKIKEVIPDNAGNYYISGDGAFNTSHLLKMTTAYSVVWDRTLSANCKVNDVELLSANCLQFVGSHDNTVTLDAFTMSLPAGTSGIDNAYVAALCDGTVGVEENVLQNSALTVYPNPATDVLNIKGDFSAVIRITDVIGREFKVKQTESNSVDVSDLTSGVYFLTIQTSDGVLNQVRFNRM
jgi:hypothetical protein